MDFLSRLIGMAVKVEDVNVELCVGRGGHPYGDNSAHYCFISEQPPGGNGPRHHCEYQMGGDEVPDGTGKIFFVSKCRLRIGLEQKICEQPPQRQSA
jgi:hypothetical protein